MKNLNTNENLAAKSVDSIDCLECVDCGKRHAGVEERNCPFALEIWDEICPVVICGECESLRCDEI